MMKKVFCVISTLLKRTFSCFTLITVAMAVTGMIVNTNEYSKYISVDLILAFFAFSVLFSISFAIADLARNNRIINGFLKFVLTYLSLAVVFFFGGAFSSYVEANGVQNKGFSILAISFMFVIIYVLCALVSFVFGFLKSKAVNSQKEYESMFDNK